MSWASTEIVTNEILSKIEQEILDLSPTGSWGDNDTGKISLAKEILGGYLELELGNMGISVDEGSGKVLLDVIGNPQVFDLSCAYLCLYLIYDDLSNMGMDEGYSVKARKYKQKYEKQLKVDLQRMNLDLNIDGGIDIYRIPNRRSIVR